MVNGCIKIRKAKKKDFENFFKLQKEFFQQYRAVSRYPIKALSKKDCKKEFSSRFGKNRFFYVAECNKELIGYLFGIIEESVYGRWGIIEDLFITKKFQGKGIATLLKDKFITILKNKQIKYCKIDVNPENKKAIKVYHKWGFRVDKYRMTKIL